MGEFPERTCLIGPKVNLFLKVGGVRADGYHPLSTVFQSLEPVDFASPFSDSLTLSLSAANDGPGATVTFTCDDPALSDDNLALRAIMSALGLRHSEASFAAHLRKGIPHGAGLGGGSMDAACALAEAIDMLHLSIPGEELAAAALRLGSDVPFGLVGGCAYAEGRGELLQPMPSLQTAFFTLAVPVERVSTREAFSWLDQDRLERVEAGGGRSEDAAALDEAVANWISADAVRAALAMDGVAAVRAVADLMHNDFESSVVRRLPVIDELKRAAQEAGALTAMLSGSGSAVFALSVDRSSAELAADSMAKVAPGVKAAVMRPAVSAWRRQPVIRG